MKTEARDIYLVLVMSFLSILVYGSAQFLAGYVSPFMIYSVFLFVTVLLFSIEIFRRLQRENRYMQQQVQAKISLLNYIVPKIPLPPMVNRAIAPDTGLLLVDQAIACRPKCIVELGCGISTLLFAYTLKKEKIDGHIYSVENNADYLEYFSDKIEQHGLSEFVTLINSPLKSLKSIETNTKWYDIDLTLIPTNIDLLFVDGPPGTLGKLARHPALEVFSSRMSETGVVVIDDSKRKDEAQLASDWKLRSGGEIRNHDTQFGNAIITNFQKST